MCVEEEVFAEEFFGCVIDACDDISNPRKGDVLVLVIEINIELKFHRLS